MRYCQIPREADGILQAVCLNQGSLQSWCCAWGALETGLRAQVGARPLAPRDQAAPPGEQDAQKLQEPASTSYTDLACAAADFQARGSTRTSQ